MKTLRNLIIAASILMLGAGSLHATPFGCDPFPRKPQKPQGPTGTHFVEQLDSKN